jgi:hypothetical protein
MSALTLPEPSVANVFITDELIWRVPEKVDYLLEKLALQDMAARVRDSEPMSASRRVITYASMPRIS